MTVLDPRTVIAMSSLLGGMMAVVLTLLSRTTPKPVPGLREWALGTWMIFFSAVLIALRDSVAHVFSITLANALLEAACLMYLYGSYRYYGRVFNPVPWLVAVVLSLAFLAWNIHVEPNFRYRLIAVAGLLAVIQGWHGVALIRFARQRTSRTSVGERFTAFWLLALALVFAMRWVHAVFLSQDGAHLMAGSLVQSAYNSAFTVGLLMLTIGVALMAFERLRDEFEHQATHDMLTGAANRRAVLDRLDAEFARSTRYQRPLSLLMMDLDHFKSVNDHYGHQMGDKVLQRFARLVGHSLRPNDVLGRTGGEEFVVVLPETALHDAHLIAQRILLTVAQPPEAGLPPSTVSIGVSEWQVTDASAASLLERADRAMYAAKSNGRNRVEQG